jgi:hypothetical protein
MRQLWKGWGSPDKVLGPAALFRITFVDPDVRIPPPDNYLQVLGEQNCIFIEKNKVDPFFPSL